MFNLRNKKSLAIAALGLLVILACKTVQINVQVNIGLTSTATAGTIDQTMTSTAISETPSFAVVSPTGTFTPSPEPIPRLAPGQPISITSMNMFGSTTGWGFESSGHILHTLDGGRTWSDVTPPQSSGTFYAEDPGKHPMQAGHGNRGNRSTWEASTPASAGPFISGGYSLPRFGSSTEHRAGWW